MSLKPPIAPTPAAQSILETIDTRLDSVESESVQAGNLGSAYTLDCDGRFNTLLVGTLNADCTITVSNLPAGGAVTLQLTQDATGGRTVEFSPEPTVLAGPLEANLIPASVSVLTLYSTTGSDLIGLAVTGPGIYVSASQPSGVAPGSVWFEQNAGGDVIAVSEFDADGDPVTVLSVPWDDQRAWTLEPVVATNNGTFTANRCIWNRVRGTKRGATGIRIQVGVQSGNISVGVYSNSGSGRSARPALPRKATSGAVACPAAGTALIALGSTIDVLDGDWLCLSVDNATASFRRPQAAANADQILGQAWTQGSGHPVPSSFSGEFSTSEIFYMEAE